MTSTPDFGGTLPSAATDTAGPIIVPQPTSPLSHNERLVFTGSGTEYFGIWIVNLLLSIVTLGIYSAWAKVRKAKYMYGATSVAGTSFEYHGNPVAILKGRAIALLLLVGYQGALVVSKPVGLLVFFCFLLVMPWLVWKSLQYKLHNSSFRGIRFSFRGRLGDAYVTYLAWPLLNPFTLLLLSPFVHQRIKRYQHGESYFGQTRFGFTATAGAFYRRYALAVLIAVAGAAVIITAVVLGPLNISAFAGANGVQLKFMFGFIGVYVWLLTLFPLFFTLIQNLIWSNTTLGASRFDSQMKWGRLTFIAVTNLLGIIVTLGLFTPFAQVRALRYRIESLSIDMADNLDQFMAAPSSELAATGEGVSDLLGFDISL